MKTSRLLNQSKMKMVAKSELKKMLGDFRNFEHNRVNIGENRYVEFSDEEGKCISYSSFGSYIHNLFSDITWWPRIGESVKSLDGDIFEVKDVLTYRSDAKDIKRFYLKKKTERKTITNV